MRFMLMHKLDERVPENFNPGPEFLERMGRFMKEVAESGVLLAGEGLRPSSMDAARITVSDGKRTVTDGPFAESKELIAGFALLQVRSKEEAIEWASRFVDVFGDTPIEVDIRRVAEMSNFDQPASPA